MDKLTDIFTFLTKFFEWYFIVMPWEQAVFVRGGKHSKVLGGGLYFKIPFLDMVYKNTTRMRMIDGPIQTVTTKDGHAITIKSGVSYKIKDMLKLYNSLFHPENTMLNIVMCNISQFVSETDLVNLTPQKIQEAAGIKNQACEWGLEDVNVGLNNYAIVRTFRLIQDQTSFWGEQLQMGHIGENK